MDKTTEDKIKYSYQHGKDSIQDLARINRVTVDEVLSIIGESHLGTVTTQGDMIDASEVGPGATLNYGKQFKVPFSTD